MKDSINLEVNYMEKDFAIAFIGNNIFLSFRCS